ncbi:hypothetical protein WR25_21035 [Diploscapter pachys]|uniref:phosphoribosylamine--glycine ligase n=1 Tax=Diploscapter pachys TaxID=2018661 RepID=A0A2A2LJV7_9BILA|nr:hypothetical protein WR25_21035 [Diploscapter pachys]
MPSSVLVLGSGGREHAIAWALYRNEHTIYVSPGNGGSKFTQIDLNLDDERDICSWCEANGVIHVIVGPEALLEKDIVNRIHNINPAIRVFGPTKDAAQLEISKIYAKEFMKQNDVATADYYVINKDTEESAIEDIIRKKCSNWQNGIVVKMDGLASGKGVTLTNNTEDAIEEVKKMQKAGNGQVLVEERLNGIELSALAFCDGKVAIRMPLVKDHKRLLEGDKGPNTGGMGVVGPIFVSNQIDRQIDEIFEKTLNGMRDRKTPYKGVLYAGLMVVDGTVYVLEFNCRFGDPETQVLMPLLDDDLLRIVNSCWDENLSHTQVRWFDSAYACAVVVAANDYPYSSDKGTPITISQNNDNAIIFHAGTKKNGDKLETNGGRIFCVTGMAPNIDDARKNALRKIESIEFEGKQFRKDIGMADLNEITGAANCASYSSSGVSIEQGNEFVDKIKRHIQSTLIEGTEQIGGFGAQIDLNRLGLGLNGELVVGMDGVGTKIEVASTVGDYSQVGNDLVAMCANDVLCHAARPIAFLDYFVCGKLELKMAEQLVASICEACNAIKCAVVGGETAEMPQVYGEKQWDLAGCMIAVRQFDWPKLPSDATCEGDKIIGLLSSGVHSNGFSLIRQILTANQIDYSTPVPWDNDQNDTIGENWYKRNKM